MGLDMYLARKQYIGANYEHRKVSGFPSSIMMNGEIVPIEAGRISYIEYAEVYWRKANQIHNWFVTELAEGRDECQEIYVERGDLENLRDICEKVLADPGLAADLLPVQSGFFFGSTEYDEYYFQDLEHTATELSRILDNPDYILDEFYYRASW
jgi:hypothetical protein